MRFHCNSLVKVQWNINKYTSSIHFITRKMLDHCGVYEPDQAAHRWFHGTQTECEIINWVCQPGQLHRHCLSSTLKSLPCRCIVHVWPFPPSTTVYNLCCLCLSSPCRSPTEVRTKYIAMLASLAVVFTPSLFHAEVWQ